MIYSARGIIIVAIVFFLLGCATMSKEGDEEVLREASLPIITDIATLPERFVKYINDFFNRDWLKK